MAQRVGRGIALLYHNRGTRRGWVVSSTPRPHFTPGKDPVPIVQEGGWASGPVWTGGKSRPHRQSIPDPPACSQSLYRLNYPAPKCDLYCLQFSSIIYKYSVLTWQKTVCYYKHRPITVCLTLWHSEERASWYILVIKPTRCTKFENLVHLVDFIIRIYQ